ncbi:phage holin family protein [Phaeodactylibacter luteus]|uniref:Phage holin family protein n=1 Tax=Phaeodactylibacter luteus TaxID=1564516 RepID=A0A5C6RG19_9BACT|nr:phage holin family protein [Phaeodactylibacter luteus]TXB61266.1 hypothetical protein FRY97_19930 [Phaeodactylibacter luteus]
MKPTESLNETLGEAYGYLKAYLHQQLEYYKLDTAERLSHTLSLALTIAILAGMSMLFTVFLSVAGALYLGERLGSLPLGFLLVSGAYALLTLFLLIFRKQLITNPILSKIIQVFFQTP